MRARRALRALPPLSLTVLLLAALPAAAHPEEYETSGGCPCIEVLGQGQRSASVVLSRTTKVYQENFDLSLGSVPLRGWLMRDSRDRIVAGYALINDPRLTEDHTIAPRGPVTLPPGRYRISRLTSSNAPVRIPVSRGAVRVVARAATPVQVLRAYSTGPVAATASAKIPNGARVLFTAGGQGTTARARLDTCLSRSASALPRCTSVEDTPDLLGTSAILTATTLLQGGETQATVSGSGVGTQGVAALTTLSFR